MNAPLTFTLNYEDDSSNADEANARPSAADESHPPPSPVTDDREPNSPPPRGTLSCLFQFSLSFLSVYAVIFSSNLFYRCQSPDKR